MDDVPGQPRRRHSPSGPRKRPSSRMPRRTPNRRRSSGEESAQGEEAMKGVRQLQSRKLSQRFAMLISLLIGGISILFALASIQLFENKLKRELARYGFEQGLALKDYGQKVFSSYRPNKYYVGSKEWKKDKAVLENEINARPRIYGITIFNGRKSIMHVGAGIEEYVPPKEVLVLDLPNWDPEVQIWVAKLTVKGQTEEAMHIRLPTGKKIGNDQGFVHVAISQATVKKEVAALTPWTFGAVIFCILLGVLVARRLAAAVTQPISFLVEDVDIVARGDLSHQMRVRTTDEIGVLARRINRFVRGLREAQEKEEQHQRLNSDLNMAQVIMAHMMPKKIPDIPGLDIHPFYRPAREVGGDYYDFIPVDERHLAFVVADVSGKSVGGAMVAGTTRTIIRLMAPRNLSPADVLAQTNHHIFKDIPRGMFVTCMYALYNVSERTLIVASAGHNPILIWRADTGEVESVRPNGIALGFDSGKIFNKTVKEKSINIRRGDRVLIYTDGVVEAMNLEHEEWGDQSLKDFMAVNSEKSSRDFCRLLETALDKHKGKAEQHDDITFTTFRVAAAGT